MKFVFNQEKNDHARKLLMMQPKVEEAKAALEKDDTDARAWYEYGTALGNAGQLEEAARRHKEITGALAPWFDGVLLDLAPRKEE